jgi:NAD(P)-dependent dehydrogenase (short-subunit alcohol dehydrogenase family)
MFTRKTGESSGDIAVVEANNYLDKKVYVVTGCLGLLGQEHVKAIKQAGGRVFGLDLADSGDCDLLDGYQQCNITDQDAVIQSLDSMLRMGLQPFGLVNNAAINPVFSSDSLSSSMRVETFDIDYWNTDLSVGLTGAFICSKVFGSYFAKNNGGVILNIASDLSVTVPDNRIYRSKEFSEDQQPCKPISYSVTKAGLVSLTKYLAVYWAKSNVRVNALSPGGVFVDQDQHFVDRLVDKIPMARMAQRDESICSLIYLVTSLASILWLMVEGIYGSCFC